MTEQEAREKIRYYLKWMSDISDYVGGNGTFVPPFSTDDAHLFSQLITKFKYDKEFSDALAIYSGKKSANSRSRKR